MAETTESTEQFVNRCDKVHRAFIYACKWNEHCAADFRKALGRLQQLSKALDPIREWYSAEGNRSDLEILTDAVADLQKDRAAVLEQKKQIEQLEEELGCEKVDREIEKTVDDEAILGLRAEVERQQEVIRELTKASNKVSGMLGHEHWDDTQRHGAGCTLCIKQGEIYNEIKAAIAQAEEIIKPGETNGE